MKTYVVGTHMSTHNICFCAEIRKKIIFSLNKMPYLEHGSLSPNLIKIFSVTIYSTLSNDSVSRHVKEKYLMIILG